MDNEQTKPPLITVSPDVLSGTPVFAGTRVPVKTLIDYLQAGESIDDFLAGFPSVEREQVIAFLEEATESIGGPNNLISVKEYAMPNWREHIHSDPDILLGKPVVKGTRLAVDFLLGLLAAGWSEQQLLESYPALTPDALRAVFAFAAESLSEAGVYPVPSASQS